MNYESGTIVQSKETGEILEVESMEENGLLVVFDGVNRAVQNPRDLNLVAPPGDRPYR